MFSDGLKRRHSSSSSSRKSERDLELGVNAKKAKRKKGQSCSVSIPFCLALVVICSILSIILYPRLIALLCPDSLNIVLCQPMIFAVKQINGFDWSNCNDTVGNNRSAQLFEQLVAVRDVFIKHNVSHMIADGTLIGAMRDYGMNPHETDNDIVLLQDAFPFDVYSDLFERGFILFHGYKLWHVCKYSPKKRENKTPWDKTGKYFVETDIYPTDWGDGYIKENYFTDWNHKIIQRQFGNTFMFTVDDETADRALTKIYGNWRKKPVQ